MIKEIKKLADDVKALKAFKQRVEVGAVGMNSVNNRIERLWEAVRKMERAGGSDDGNIELLGNVHTRLHELNWIINDKSSCGSCYNEFTPVDIFSLANTAYYTGLAVYREYLEKTKAKNGNE